MRGTSLSLGQLDWEHPDDAGPGRGTGIRWKLLFSARRTPTGEISIGLAEIAAGGKLPLHRHAPAEVYHVTEGEGVVHIDEDEYELRPGTAVFIPPQAWHETSATGSVPLRFLFIFSAESFEDVGYEYAADG
jgi:quercetin dioxygenase-like cupin family protein